MHFCENNLCKYEKKYLIPASTHKTERTKVTNSKTAVSLDICRSELLNKLA